MTRIARNPTMYAKYGNRYVAPPAKYNPDPNPKAYPTIPESYPKILGFRKHQKPYTNAPYPDGLVDIYGENGIMGPCVRRISPEYLDQRFKGKSNVADRQRYIQKIIDNPRSLNAWNSALMTSTPNSSASLAKICLRVSSSIRTSPPGSFRRRRGCNRSSIL